MILKPTQTLLTLCLLSLILLPASSRAQTDFAALLEPLKTFRYGDSPAQLDKIAGQVADARLSPDRRRDAARALASILPTTATFEAKQFACRQLVFVAGDEQVPALAALLTDKELTHYALLVLARLHSPAAADAVVQALPSASGKTEIELLDTLADFGDARAVSAASQRLNSTDPLLRNAAAADLAKLADPKGVQALRSAYTSQTGATRIELGRALLDVASRLQRRGDTKAALEIYDLLERTPASPFLGAAALRGIAGARGEQSLPILMQALGEDGSRRQDAAATVLREMPGHAVVTRLAGDVAKMHGQGQLLAIEILGDRGDPAAAASIAALCKSADPNVRQAALHAAGSLGDASIVTMLLSAASGGVADERSAARDSLVRLRGASVDRALLAALDSGAPAVQAQAIQALGQRAAIGISPRLMKAARSSNTAVSAAALKVLRDQGSPALLPALVDLMLAQPPDGRDAALDAVTQVARRNPNPEIAMTLLIERLVSAAKPADRVILVGAVGQVGGPGALEALRKASADPSPEVRLASLSALAEWPTDEPMGDLLRVARTTTDARVRTIALRGYLRMAAGGEQRSPAEALALFKDVGRIATRPEEKRLILAGLSKVPSLESLQFAVAMSGDKEVRPESELAVTEIARATIGAWPAQTRAALEPIATAGVNADARARAHAILAVGRKFGDFVVAWEVSPEYHQDGADYTRLFDIAFPAEDPDAAKVPWRPMPAGANPDQPWLLDLLALWGGEQRVAYLRTAVRSETVRDLVLEMGSDDGLKAWWNGQIVLSHNIARAVAPAQEKVTVHAKAGWNRLLLKVTQNNQGWGACARFTNPDGTPVTGLQFAPPLSAKGEPAEH